MVGPLGYLADISRTLVCPGKSPTADQRKLYDIAQEQILTNIELIKPASRSRSSARSAGRFPTSTCRTAT